MKKKFLLICLVIFMRASCLSAAPYKADEVLIKFKDTASPRAFKDVKKDYNASPVRKFNINDFYLYRLPRNLTPLGAEKKFRKDPDIEYIEPNYKVELNAIPNDPQFKNQTGLKQIKAPEAWDIVTGNANIIIAVVDTGIDYNHEDLDVENGYDFYNNDADPMDDNGHGTFVAGVIGAVGNNEIGITGVCWQARIIPVKFTDSTGSGFVSQAIQGIQYAVNNGARIINTSWSGPDYSISLYEAIKTAGEMDVLFIATAGNDGKNIDSDPIYPACYSLPNIIVVTAVDQNDQLLVFSNYGHYSVDAAAPGLNILSTIRDNDYATQSGTSAAAPFVSGVCSLIWAKYPELSHLEVKARLLSSVDIIDSLKDKIFSNGRINSHKALTIPPEEIQPIVYVKGGRFYSDKDATQEITRLTIKKGTSSVSFYYLDDQIGAPTITAKEISGLGITPATQTEKIISSTTPEEEMRVGINIYTPTWTSGVTSGTPAWVSSGIMQSSGVNIDVGDKSAPAFADLDNDGDLDMVVGEYNYGVNYYKNTGTNNAPVWTLQTGVTGLTDSNGQLINSYSSRIPGKSYSSPTFADLNNDGLLDMIVGLSSAKIAYYQNTGTASTPSWTSQGLFVDDTPAIIDVGSRSHPSLADLDNDGDLDMLIGSDTGVIYYYRNDGTNTVPAWTNAGQISQVIDTGNTATVDDANPIDVGSYSAPTFVDLDNDSDLDMIIGESTGLVYYYRNDGSITSPSWVLAVSVSDLTNSSGQFIKTDTFAIDAGDICQPCFADLDNDGDLDLIAGENDGIINYYQNTGDDTNGPAAPSLTVTSATPTANSVTLDITPIANEMKIANYLVSPAGDTIYANSGKLQAYAASSTWTLPANAYYNQTCRITAHLADASDYISPSGTGIATLQYTTAKPMLVSPVTASYDGTNINLGWTNVTGETSYAVDRSVDYASWTNLTSVLPADTVSYTDTNSVSNNKYYRYRVKAVNANGGDYAYTAINNGPTITWTSGVTSGTPVAWVSAEKMQSGGIAIDVGDVTNSSYSAPTLVDLDNDSDLDMISGNNNGDIYYYRNDDTNSAPVWTSIGQFTDSDSVLIDVGSRSKPTFADIDNDSDMDMLIGNNSGYVYYYKNTGTNSSFSWTLQVSISGLTNASGQFTNNVDTTIDIGSQNAPSLADLDNDGDLDMVIGESGGKIIYYRNDNTSTSPSWVLTDATTPWTNASGQFIDNTGAIIDVGSYSTPTFADLDNDGDLDMLLGESGGDNLSYKNVGTNTSPSWALQTSVSGLTNEWGNLIDTTGDDVDPGSNSAPVYADLDNDGDLDIICGASTGNIHYFQNTGDDTNGPASSISINEGATTTSTTINLTLSSTGANQMKIVNYLVSPAGDTIYANVGRWENYATTKSWLLPANVPDGTTCKIYVNYLNSSYYASGRLSASTTYSVNTAPVLGYTADNVIPAAQITQEPDGSGVVTIRLKIKDAESNTCELNSFQWSYADPTSWTTPAVGDNDSSLVGFTGMDKGSAPAFVDAPEISFTYNTREPDPDLNGSVKFMFKCGDGALQSNYATSELFTVDNTTAAPTLALPCSSGTDNSSLAIDFTLAEAASTGTVKMTFTRTGGTADANGPHVITFAAGFETQGNHTATLNGADLSANANVTSVSSSPNDLLVSMAVYSVKIEYQDSQGNAVASVTNTLFTYDTTVPVISSTGPASSATVNNTQVSYTLSEAVSSGTVTWTRTGGSADGSSHVQTLSGAELNTGAHNNITLADDPTLVNGAIYSIAFDVTDAAGNTAVTITNTLITYDNATAAPTLALPCSSGTDNSSLAIDFTLAEAASTGTVKMTFTRTGGTADANGPHVITFASGFESQGQHTTTLNGADLSDNVNVTSVSSSPNDLLVSMAIYSVKIEYQDSQGNAVASVTNTLFTYDNTPPALVDEAGSPLVISAPSEQTNIKDNDDVTVSGGILSEAGCAMATQFMIFDGSTQNPIPSSSISISAIDNSFTGSFNVGTLGSTNTVSLRVTVMDSVGNVSGNIESNSLNAGNDQPPVISGFDIIEGDFAGQVLVHCYILSPASIQYKFSPDSDIDSPAKDTWFNIPSDNTVATHLTSSNGVKTVKMKFMTSNGNATNWITRTTSLNIAGPQINIVEGYPSPQIVGALDTSTILWNSSIGGNYVIKNSDDSVITNGLCAAYIDVTTNIDYNTLLADGINVITISVTDPDNNTASEVALIVKDMGGPRRVFLDFHPKTGTVPQPVDLFYVGLPDTEVAKVEIDVNGDNYYDVIPEANELDTTYIYHYEYTGNIVAKTTWIDGTYTTTYGSITINKGDAPSVTLTAKAVGDSTFSNEVTGTAPFKVVFKTEATFAAVNIYAQTQFDFDNNGGIDYVTKAGLGEFVYTFNKPGIYFSKARVIDNAAFEGENYCAVTVIDNSKPAVTAGITGAAAGQAPLTVNFTGTATPASGRTISFYTWDFDNDEFVDWVSAPDAANGNASYTFRIPGTYNAILEAVDSAGVANSDMIEVVVSASTTVNPPTIYPWVDTMYNNPVMVPVPVTLETGSGGSNIAPSKVSVDFDNDGNWDMVRDWGGDFEHIYEAAGYYKVKAQAKAVNGLASNTTFFILCTSPNSLECAIVEPHNNMQIYGGGAGSNVLLVGEFWGGTPTSAEFQYQDAYGDWSSPTSLEATINLTNGMIKAVFDTSSLTSGSSYDLRLACTNASGTVYSTDRNWGAVQIDVLYDTAADYMYATTGYGMPRVDMQFDFDRHTGIRVEDGTTINFPPESFGAADTFRAEVKHKDELEYDPYGIGAIGMARDLGFPNNPGATSSKPILVSIPYMDNDNDGYIETTDGVNTAIKVDTLEAYSYDSTNTEWNRIYFNVVIDKVKKTINFYTNHFSEYGGSGTVEDPTLALSDASSGNANYTNNATITVAVGNDTNISKWLISETQSTQPTAGDANWSTEPASYTFDSSTDGTKTVYIWVKDAADNINVGPVSDTIYLDTTGPAGTMSISFSNITTTAIYVTGAALVDAGEGSEYYEFDCTTSDTFDRARTLNDNVNEATGMSANTQYTFKYKASDGMKELGESASNYSAWSSAYSKYTLANTPANLSLTATSSTITCTWTGDATQYQVQYALNSGFTNSTSSSWQTAKTLTISSLNSSTTYYVRVKGRNGDSVETSSSSTANATTSIASVTTTPEEEDTAPTEETTTPIVTTEETAEPTFIEAEQEAEPVGEETETPSETETTPTEPQPQPSEEKPEEETGKEAPPTEETTEQPPKESEKGPEAPSEAYDITKPVPPSAKGKDTTLYGKIRYITTITVLEGSVNIFDLQKPGITFDEFRRKKYRIAVLTEVIKPYTIVKIDIFGLHKLAYIPKTELQSELEKLETVLGIPLLVHPSSKPEFNTEYDVAWIGIVVREGQEYREEKILSIEEKAKSRFELETDILKQSAVEHNKKDIDKFRIETLKQIAPKDAQKLLEEIAPSEKKKGRPIILIIISLIGIAIVFGLLIRFKKK